MLANIFVVLVAAAVSRLVNANDNDTAEFIRLPFSQPQSRFEALYTCKQTLEGSFASSYYLDNKTIEWVFTELNRNNDSSLAFHRDLFNDTSYLNHTVWRTFDGFPLKEPNIFLKYENSTIEVTYSSFVEKEDKKRGIFICESTPCGIGNWIYLNGNCYHLGPKNLNQAYTWSQSRNYCKAVGSDLVVISNEVELDLITQLIEPFRIDAFVYIGFYYSPKNKNWEWINNFQSNIKNFYGINQLSANNNNTYRNVSMLFKPGNSSQISLRLVEDNFELIGSDDFEALLTFVCKKKILSCESIPVIKYATFKIRSNFLEHDYLIYDCLPGYELTRGDRTRLCNLNGKWRGHDIECLKKQCEPPKVPEDAYILSETIHSAEKPYSYQDAVVFACLKDYRMIGNDSIRVCNESGMWSGVPIRCERTKCKHLVAPKYTELAQNESHAEYKCDKGYELFYGISTRICNTVTAEWTGIDPVCDRVFHCANGYFNFGSYCLKFFDLEPVAKMTYKDAWQFCNLAKLELFSSNTIYDLRFEVAGKHKAHLVFLNSSIQNLTQSDETLKCFDLRSSYLLSIVECEKPFTLTCAKKRTLECPPKHVSQLVNNQYSDSDASENGLVASSVGQGFFSLDYEIILTCREGFTPSQSNSMSFDTIRCSPEAKWSEPRLKCKRITCPEITTDSKNLKCVGKGNAIGSKRACFCLEGFYMRNQTWGNKIDFVVTTCGPLGSWSEKIPTCTAINCEKPIFNNQILLIKSNEASYPIGSVIEFECNKGYKLSSTSSKTAKCLPNGSWSAPLPTCEKIKCRNYGQFKNLAIPPNFVFEYLNFIEYKCPLGFHICGQVGESVKFTCVDEDTWAPDMISCCRNECSMAGLNLVNAEASQNRYVFNDKITLYCSDGFKYSDGSQNRTCLADGTWSGRQLVCTEQKCDESVKFTTNAKLVSFSNKIYGKAEFKCNNNERAVSGNLIRYCTALGWTGKPAFCEEIYCQVAEGIENGIITNPKQIYPVNSSVTYECASGYAILGVGNKTRTCQSNGEWSGMMPTCEEISCPYLATPSNCDLTQNGSSLNSIAEFRCHFGYKFKNVNASVIRRRCLRNFTWDRFEPSCEMIQCPDIGEKTFSFGNHQVDCLTYSCQARYECWPNHDLIIGDSFRICGIDGKWSGEEAICKPKELLCPIPNQTANTLFEINSLLVGSVAHYHCPPGFHITNGQSERTCLPDQTWSGIEPVCEPKICGPPPNIPHSFVRVLSIPYPEFPNSLGTFISYACQPGYLMVDGKNLKTCNLSGSWSGPDLICKEKENKSSSEIERYDQKKKMSKAFGTIAISFIVVIYGTVILIDINWRLLYRLARKAINKMIILIQIVHKKLKN